MQRVWAPTSRAARILPVVLTIVLLALFASQASAQQAGSMQVRPDRAAVGAVIALTGEAVPAACAGPVTEVLVTTEDGTAVGEAYTDTAGTWAFDAPVPELAAGPHVLVSRCRAVESSELIELATADLEVLPEPSTSTTPAPQPASDNAPEQGDVAGQRPSEPATSEQAQGGDDGDDGADGDDASTDTAGSVSRLPRADDGDDTAATAPGQRTAAVEGGQSEDSSPTLLDDAAADAPAGPQGAPMWAPERWGPASHIADLTDPELTGAGAGAAAALLVVFSLLIGFPATMFDGTYRRHYDEIADGLRRRLPRISSAADRLTSAVPSAPLLAMVLFGTMTAAAVDTQLALDVRTAGVLVGLAVVIGLGGWLGWWPTKRTSDAYGNDGNYRAYPMGLLVAVACVALTRFGNLHPGYLYGLLFAYDVRGRWTAEDDGRTYLYGFLAVLAAGLTGWFLLSTLQPAGGDTPGLLAIALDTILGGLAVVGVEGVVFGMVPFTFTPGAAIWKWSRGAWLGLWSVGVLALAVMLSTPHRELLGVDGEGVSVVRAAVAFGVFTVASLVFWSYWRRVDRQRSTAPEAATVDA